jgi:hypothetical protein
MAAAAMTTGARLFYAQTAEGETMLTFACLSFQDLLISLGFMLGLGAAFIFGIVMIVKVFRSGR